MKTFVFLALLLIYSYSFSQEANIEKLKKENASLLIENKKLKGENETLKNNVSKLQQDTTYLIKKNEFCSQILQFKDFKVEHTFPNYNIQLLSCKGDRTKQQVIIELLVTNQNVNHFIAINDIKPYAMDILGNKYSVFEISDTEKKWILYGPKNTFPTNVPIKLFITIKNILPSLEAFKVINVPFFFKAEGTPLPINAEIIFKDLKIIW